MLLKNAGKRPVRFEPGLDTDVRDRHARGEQQVAGALNPQLMQIFEKAFADVFFK